MNIHIFPDTPSADERRIIHHAYNIHQRQIQGAQAPFLAKSILFSTLYTMSERIFFKLNLDFIVAEIRGVFGSMGGVCVCV